MSYEKEMQRRMEMAELELWVEYQKTLDNPCLFDVTCTIQDSERELLRSPFDLGAEVTLNFY